MKSSFIKKILVLLSLIIMGLIIIYYSDLKNSLFKNDVYIIFDVKQENYKEFELSKYAHLFPKDFNPEKVIIDKRELLKLNKKQLIKFDSIKKELYQFPHKIITLDNNKRVFSIAVNSNIEIKFKSVNRKKIKSSTLNTLNILSLDSLIQIIPDLEYLQLKKGRNNIKKLENIRFNIIELDKNKVTVIEVEPIVIEYN